MTLEVTGLKVLVPNAYAALFGRIVGLTKQDVGKSEDSQEEGYKAKLDDGESDEDEKLQG